MLLLWPRHSVHAGALQPGKMVWFSEERVAIVKDEIVPVLEPVVA